MSRTAEDKMSSAVFDGIKKDFRLGAGESTEVFSGGMARVVWDEGVAGLKGVIGRSRAVYHSE